MGRNGGRLKPLRSGEGQKTGYHKPSNYVETLHLARKATSDAMRTLIKCLNDPDSRTAVAAASSTLQYCLLQQSPSAEGVSLRLQLQTQNRRF